MEKKSKQNFEENVSTPRITLLCMYEQSFIFSLPLPPSALSFFYY